MVERYNIYPYDQYSTDERTSPTGDWVRYEDYQALQAQLAKAREENQRLHKRIAALVEDDTRMRKALALLDTPTPSPSPDALVKAAEMMVKAYREESDKVITAFYALEDALAAMKEGGA